MIGLIGAVSLRPRADDAFPSAAERYLRAAETVPCHSDDRWIAGAADPAYAKTADVFEAADGTVVLFTGYLYNDRDAAISDVEYLYNEFRAHGSESFKTLNGSFACLIHDAATSDTFLVVDRLASWPILYAVTNAAVYFAPVATPFNNAAGVSRRLSDSALVAMFANGHMLAGDTYFEQVHSMLPGNYLRITGETAGEHAYWRYDVGQHLSGDDIVTAKSNYYDRLVRAVERRFKRHPEAPVLMSGGADSRAILGCCLELGYSPKLLSYAVNPTPGSDTDIAKRIAARTGCAFEMLPYQVDDMLGYVRTSTTPYSAMRGSIYEYQALDRLRGTCDSVWLGDESFGWDSHALETEADMFATVGVQPIDVHTCWRSILTPESFERLSEAGRQHLASVSGECTYTELHDRKDFFYTMLRLPRNILLGRRYLAAHIAAPLAPWLDYDLIDFIAGLGIPHRLGKALFREVAVESFPRMFEVPYAHVPGMPSDFAWFRQAVRAHPRIIKEGCFDGDSPIDASIDRDALQHYFEHAKPTFLHSARSAVMQSRASKAARIGIDLSRRLRRASRRISQQRARAGMTLTPRHVFERIAQIRYYTSQKLDVQ